MILSKSQTAVMDRSSITGAHYDTINRFVVTATGAGGSRFPSPHGLCKGEVDTVWQMSSWVKTKLCKHHVWFDYFNPVKLVTSWTLCPVPGVIVVPSTTGIYWPPIRWAGSVVQRYSGQPLAHTALFFSSPKAAVGLKFMRPNKNKVGQEIEWIWF